MRKLTGREMKYPDIPSAVSPSLSHLVGLRTLRLMGNTTVPCELTLSLTL
jgi:hypothetical protein